MIKQNLGNRLLKPEESRETEVGIDAIIKEPRLGAALVRRREDHRPAHPHSAGRLRGLHAAVAERRHRDRQHVRGHDRGRSREAPRRSRGAPASWPTARATGSPSSIAPASPPAPSSSAARARRWARCTASASSRARASCPPSAAASASQFAVNDEGLLVWVGEGNTLPRRHRPRQLLGHVHDHRQQRYRWGMPITARDSTGSAALVKHRRRQPRLQVRHLQHHQLARCRRLHARGTRRWAATPTTRPTSACTSTAGAATSTRTASRRSSRSPSSTTSTLYAANSPTDYFVENAGFVKLRELSVRYQLPPQLLGRAQPRRVRAACRSRSSGATCSRSRTTRATTPRCGNVLNRLDSFDYPRYRTITGSIEITF